MGHGQHLHDDCLIQRNPQRHGDEMGLLSYQISWDWKQAKHQIIYEKLQSLERIICCWIIDRGASNVTFVRKFFKQKVILTSI